jgi:uncharacterized small protein (DUF1192 family)
MKELPAPNAAHEGNQRRDNLMPMRYVIGIISVLVILVLGIVTPDILQYRAQLAERSSTSGSYLDSKILISLTNAVGKGVNTNLILVLGGTNTNVSLALSGAAGSEIVARVVLCNPISAGIVTNAPPPTIFSPAPMTTPFEPYARLVTLLLSIVSVLGLFFAYFVRKSLHETEEALEKRFDRNMELWKTEQKTVAAQAAQVTADANEVKLRVQEVNELSRQIKEVTAELDRTDKQAAQKSSSKAEVAQASSVLDAQISDPSKAAVAPESPEIKS